ncbi:MAG: acetylglutamate kinase [Gammaproteobacteria bacterium]
MSKITDIIAGSLKYVKKLSGQCILIKLGGSILDDMQLVRKLCEDLSLVRAAGIKIVLVHGGSKAIDQTLRAHNISWAYQQGQRITTIEMVNIIEMVLSGHVNKMLVRTLNAVGVAAVGLAGCDDKLLQAQRFDDKLGEVGKIEKVNTTLLQRFMDTQDAHQPGIIPVIAPIAADAQGKPLNVNADWAASTIAIALKCDKLIYLTDEDGVYDQDKKLLSKLEVKELKHLVKKKIVEGGMLVKVKTILDALQQGLNNIHIISAKKEHALITELFTDEGIGTICRRNAES